jgi:hypothetical protein
MEFLKKHIITLVLVVLGAIGTFTWNLIQKGGEAEINEKIDSRINSKIQDGKLVQVLLQSKEISKFTKQAGEDIRNEVIEDVMRKDTNKVSLRAIIGKGTKLRDEDVPQAIINLINDYNNGSLHCKRTHNLARI